MESAADRTRCTRCGAAVPPRAPWCTLCLASTGAPAEAGPTGVPQASVPSQRPATIGDPGLHPLTAPAEALGLPPRRSAPASPAPRHAGDGAASASWPCSACGHDNPLVAGVCGACGAAFLSGVRTAEAPLLALPLIGDLTRLHRGQRLGLAFAVMLALVGLTALLMLLLG